jgi:predicted nucleic acid-binding protein
MAASLRISSCRRGQNRPGRALWTSNAAPLWAEDRAKRRAQLLSDQPIFIMLSHLLDTSVYCQPIKPRPLASVERRWRELGDDALAISVIGEAELLYGIEWKQSARLQSQYDQLLKNRFQVLPVNSEVARIFSQIKVACRKKGFAASDFDFLIAATAKARGLILATLNVRHFRGIEGLATEDWSLA